MRTNVVAPALLAAVAVLAWPTAAQGQITGWQLEAIDAPQAQQVATGEGVVVAVLDTGVGPHPVLEGKVLEGASMVEYDPTRDGEGHGSNMAAQVLSVAPDARILPVQVGETHEHVQDQQVIEGIRWAVDHGADVINLSLSGPSAIAAEIEAIDYALDHDVVVVAGTGNDPAAEVGSPALVPGVVAVTGFDESGQRWSGATVGPETVLSAPATNIQGIIPDSPGVDPGYRVGEGTSISTALVSGVAALVRAEFPDLDAAGVINRLIRTAEDAGDPGRDDQYGFGRVDAYAAVTADVEPVDTNPLGDPTSLRGADVPPGAGAPAGGDPVAPGGGGGITATGDGSSDSSILPVAGLVAAVGVLVVVVLISRGRRKPSAPPLPPPGQSPAK